MAGALGATAATAAPCRLLSASWLAWVVLLEAHLLRRRPVAVALAAEDALASAFGVAMTKQKMVLNTIHSTEIYCTRTSSSVIPVTRIPIHIQEIGSCVYVRCAMSGPQPSGCGPHGGVILAA